MSKLNQFTILWTFYVLLLRFLCFACRPSSRRFLCISLARARVFFLFEQDVEACHSIYKLQTFTICVETIHHDQ